MFHYDWIYVYIETMQQVKIDWILVTGQPGCGKTTAVRRMVDLLQSHGVPCQGFYTDEVLSKQSHQRIGFDVVTVPDQKRGVLARQEGLKSNYKTGKYYVDVDSFESLALPTLKGGTVDTVYVLDEIGRMELHSKIFAEDVREMVKRHGKLVGAITAPRYGHRVAFCDEIAAQPGVQIYHLKKSNRDAVTNDLLQYIQDQWLSKNT